MRVVIVGENSAAQSVRTLLGKAGIRLADKQGFMGLTYTVEIIKGLGDYIELDGVPSEIEREMTESIYRITRTHILLKRAGGNQDDRKVIVTIPWRDKNRAAIEVGIFRAIERLVHPVGKLSILQRIVAML